MTAWFSWSGRIDRTTYCHWMLAVYGSAGLLAAAIALTLDVVRSDADALLLAKLATLAAIPILVAWVAANVARLHDMGRTGWHVGWMLGLNVALPATPDTGIEALFICLIPVIWLALADGSTAPNRHGLPLPAGEQL